MATEGAYNVSLNASSLSQQPLSQWFEAIKVVRNVFIPVIVCVGFFGNTLSLMVFSTESMRKSSSSVFLASLAFVDNTFLVCLLITWIDGEIHTILVTDLACQMLIYTTYVTSCLSVWFIIGFTFERFIAICFPLKSNYLCNMCREKGTVFILATIACVMYNFSFWTTGMKQWGPLMRCSHNPEYIKFLNIVTWIDTFVTMIIPFFLIAGMNSMVLRSVLKCQPKDESEKTKQRNRRLFQATSFITLLGKNNTRSTRTRSTMPVNLVQRRSPKFRVTRTLLFVSTTFLVLNLPFHTIRLYNLISSVSSNNQTVSVKFSFFQELTLLFYYITFSCNFFLYTYFGRNFRHSLHLILYCQSMKENHRQKMLQKLSSSQGRVS